MHTIDRSVPSTTRALRRIAILFAALALLWLTASLCAAEIPAAGASSAHAGRQMPEFSYPYKDGLYATITGFLKVKDVKVPGQTAMKLSIKGFRDKVPVRVVIQPRSAPLVVVLLGISGRADADFSELWQAWYAEAGYHVLAFDSTFRPEFVKLSNHGVSGNLWAETERVSQIIDAFVNSSPMQGKIDGIGVVGMSYGGVQALLLGRMARQGRLPYQLSAIQAYSPPLKLEKTAELIDRWYDEDRWQYTLAELNEKVGGHTPRDTDEPLPFTPSMMRAAISAAFRLELVDVIVRNDEHFKLNVLPRGGEFDDMQVRKDHAATWGFMQFAYELALPYWARQLGGAGIETMVKQTHLADLLADQPEYTETILTANDPFNTPEDLVELRRGTMQSRITVLPRGGHLGYIDAAWTKAKLHSLFEPGTPAVPRSMWQDALPLPAIAAP